MLAFTRLFRKIMLLKVGSEKWLMALASLEEEIKLPFQQS